MDVYLAMGGVMAIAIVVVEALIRARETRIRDMRSWRVLDERQN